MRGILAVMTIVATTAAAEAQSFQVSVRNNIQYVEHDGVKLAGDLYLPKGRDKSPVIVAVHGGGWQVGSRQSYQPGGTDIAPQVTAIAQSKADVVVLFTIPTYTALFKLTSLKLQYNPQMVVTNVGSDPTTLAGLLQSPRLLEAATGPTILLYSVWTVLVARDLRA